MTNVFELSAQARANQGKADARRVRREQDGVPAVIYGAKKDPVSVILEHSKVLKALESEAFYSQVLSLKVDGKVEKVVLKDLQRHVYKPRILHMDFLRIDAKSKLTMTVSLHFINEDSAAGVKLGGGIISHHLTEVEISCLPGDLPEYIEVDMANVELDQTVHLSDLKLPKGVELVALMHGDDHDYAVASIAQPRAEEEIPSDAPQAPETEVPGDAEDKAED